MAPHQERVIAEKSDLDDKIAKLTVFLDSETLKTLPKLEQRRLVQQEYVMREYSAILASRISNFPNFS